MRRLVLLRPEPGLAASAERARALGLETVSAPLFAVGPVPWTIPDPAGFDALLLTSANAVAMAGGGLRRFRGLRVHAVGPATADAAREAGLAVASTGSADALALVESLDPSLRLLHLCGQDRRALALPNVTAIEVYRAAEIADPRLPDLAGTVIAVHSPRAGARLADLHGAHPRATIAAISPAAAAACGDGWERVLAADQPNDPALLALAARLCECPSR